MASSASDSRIGIDVTMLSEMISRGQANMANLIKQIALRKVEEEGPNSNTVINDCLLYTSDAADDVYQV